MTNEGYIIEQSNRIEDFPFPKDIFNDSIVQYLKEKKGIFTIEQFLQMSKQDFYAFCFRSKAVKQKVLNVVHNLGYKFVFEIEDEKRKEQEKYQKSVDIYNGKIEKLKKTNAQIEKLQLLKEKLTMEIEEYSKQFGGASSGGMNK